MNDIPERVAVLEQIARETHETLVDLRSDMRTEFRELRSEFRELRRDVRSDFRWLLGIMLGGFAMTLTGFAGLLAVMAHGFHWL